MRLELRIREPALAAPAGRGAFARWKWRHAAGVCLWLALAQVPCSGAAASEAEPSASAGPQASAARRLAHNDVVQVQVYQESDLDVEVTVDANGTVMLPILGAVKIGGMSPDEAAARIQDLYRDGYLVNPQVRLSVTEFAVRRFTVLGEVQRPGAYDLPPNESVSLPRAIAMAGGFTPVAARSRVAVNRITGGVATVVRLDADAMAKNPKAKLFEVQPDDVITVDPRNF